MAPASRLKFPESAWRSPFLERWRALFAVNSEAPDPFFFAVALFLIGLIVGHRVTYRYGLTLHLNFYLGLIGPTGVKKTSAIAPAARLLRQIVPDVVQLHGISTAEGLLQILAKEPGTCIAVQESELAVLLAKTKRPESTLLPQLCRMADMPDVLDLPTRGDPLKAEAPFVSIIGASTAASIEDKIGEAEQLGGFLNRFMFFAGERKPPNPWPSSPSDSEWQALVDEVQNIRHAYGSVTPLEIRDPEARRAWESYYGRFYERQGALPEVLCGLTSREHQHVLKLAMAFCVMRGGRDISAEDMARAVEIGDYLFAVVAAVVEPIGQGAANRLESRIEALLSERAMTRRELHQKLSGRVKSADLGRALDSLIDLERITEIDGGSLAWVDAEYFARWREGAA